MDPIGRPEPESILASVDTISAAGVAPAVTRATSGTFSMMSAQAPKGDRALVPHYKSTIDESFRAFQASGAAAADLSSINRSSHALACMENVYKTLEASDSAEATALMAQIKEAREQVNALSFYSKELTGEDLRKVGTFFDPPIEKIYTAPNGQKYHQPDHSQFFRYCSPLQVRGGFQGQTCGKHQMKRGQPCDIFVLKKSNRQVELEAPPMGMANFQRHVFGIISHNELPELQAAQAALSQEVIAYLNSPEVDSWGYKNFELRTGPALHELGWNAAEAQRQFVLIGYYKKLEPDLSTASTLLDQELAIPAGALRNEVLSASAPLMGEPNAQPEGVLDNSNTESAKNPTSVEDLIESGLASCNLTEITNQESKL